MKFFTYFTIFLLSFHVICSLESIDETVEKTKRLAVLKNFMDKLEHERGLCTEEDMKTAAGKNERIEGKFVSTFYHGLFTCAKKTFTEKVTMIDCILRFIKTSNLNMQPTCVFCFIKFVQCARKHCAMRCTLDICSTSCSDCYSSHCMSDMNKCTSFNGIPKPCREK